MFIPFFYLLKDLGIPISFQYIMDFFQGLEKGLAPNLDALFLLSRLVFVKRVEHYDMFERAFLAYFLGQTDRLNIPHVESLLNTPLFQEWLKKQIKEASLDPDVLHKMELEELLQKFWETLLQQKEEHHGGGKWLGTGGTSPWGHSGRSRGGIRVQGASRNRSAMKVIGEGRYLDYSGDSDLSSENIRQALATMKRMVPVGPSFDLNVDESIYETCKNGGEIELIFEKEMRDRIQVMLFLDNGGYSMSPYVESVRLLFSKMKNQFKDLEFYYFHNTIYGGVYSNFNRTKFCSLEKICKKDKNTRLFIVGDANMGSYELLAPYGAISYFNDHPVPSIEWLNMLQKTFTYSVWLNPIHKEYWSYESSTISTIASVFHMEDLTLNGLKKAVEYLREQG